MRKLIRIEYTAPTLSQREEARAKHPDAIQLWRTGINGRHYTAYDKDSLIVRSIYHGSDSVKYLLAEMDNYTEFSFCEYELDRVISRIVRERYRVCIYDTEPKETIITEE